MSDWRQGLKEWESYCQSRQAEYRMLERQLQEVKEELAQTVVALDDATQARLLLQEVAEFAREQARQQIESLVTNALQFIFGGDTQFRVEIEEKHKQPSAEFYLTSTYEGGYRVETRPQEARGGGVVDVVSLALRVALLEACGLEGPLLLDEPGKHVSEEYSLQVATFLKQLSQSFGRQIILVTHNQHLAQSGDKAFLVEMQQGVSRVREL